MKPLTGKGTDSLVSSPRMLPALTPFRISFGGCFFWSFWKSLSLDIFSPRLDQSLADAIVQATIIIIALGSDMVCEGFESAAKHTSINFQNSLLSIINYYFSKYEDEIQHTKITYPKFLLWTKYWKPLVAGYLLGFV